MDWSPIMHEIGAREKFDASWKDLLESQPFYGAKMFSLEIVESESIPTMATDGKRLLYNPEFVLGLGLNEVTFVELHEMLHVLFLHPIISAEMKKELGESYDHMQFNIAGDYEINQIIVRLIKEGGIKVYKMPDDLLFDERFDGMLLREIYFILEAEKQQQPKQPQPPQSGEKEQGETSDDNGGNDSGDPDDSSGTSEPNGAGRTSGKSDGNGDQNSESDGSNDPSNSSGGAASNGPELPVAHGEVMTPENDDGSELSNEQIKEMRHEAEKQIVAAAKFAKKQGRGDMQSVDDIKDRILHTEQPWDDILREYFDCKIKVGSTFDRPDKRFYPHGIMLPTKRVKRIGRVAILVDESGSVSRRLSALWYDVMNEILSAFEELEIMLIPFTHEAYEPQMFSEVDLPLEYKRGHSGGTDFKPPFDVLESEEFDPDVALVLTDMLCDSFPSEPDYPVFWCEACEGYYRNRARKPPFGELIQIRE